MGHPPYVEAERGERLRCSGVRRGSFDFALTRFAQDDGSLEILRVTWRLFLAAEAVDESEVDAEVVLEGAVEGGAHVVGCDAEGKVGEEVEIDVGSDGERGAGVGR